MQICCASRLHILCHSGLVSYKIYAVQLINWCALFKCGLSVNHIFEFASISVTSEKLAATPHYQSFKDGFHENFIRLMIKSNLFKDNTIGHKHMYHKYMSIPPIPGSHGWKVHIQSAEPEVETPYLLVHRSKFISDDLNSLNNVLV